MVLLITIMCAFPLSGQEESADPDREEKIDEIRSELSSKTVDVDVHETPLRHVIDQIRKRVSFNIIFDRDVRQMLNGDQKQNGSGETDSSKNGSSSKPSNPASSKADDRPQTEQMDNDVTLELQDVTLKKAFKLVLAQKNLTAVYHHGAVFIVPEAEGRDLQIRTYDVRDLQHEITDFYADHGEFSLIAIYSEDEQNPASDTDFSDPPEGTGNSDSYGSDRYGSTPQQPETDRDYSTPDQDEQEGRFTGDQRIAELIRNNLGSSKKWKGKPSIKIMDGFLVVKQTPEMHQRIMVLLGRMRQLK